MQSNFFAQQLLTPKFYDQIKSPLSTKKERLGATPSQRYRSVPRLARTAPVPRVVAQRFAMQRPHFISYKTHSDSVLLRSRSYDPASKASYFDQCFIVDKKLGEGSFGEVFRVQSRDDNHWYAVKRSIEVFRNEADRQMKLREVQKHELLPPNPNLVAFIAAWEDRGRLYIQYELCEYSLSEYAEREHNIHEPLLWNYFTDLLLAVNHLHENGLLHLDIKPANVFITKDGIAKLGDFGLVFDLRKDCINSAQEGDSKYLAPEVLNETVSKAADIFSLGVMILELASDLDVPSGGEGWHLLREGKIPDGLLKGLSENMRRLIRWMMDPMPERRPSAQQLLNDYAVRSRIASRRRFLVIHSMFTHAHHRMFDLWILVLTFFTFLLGPLLRAGKQCWQAITRSNQDAICTTPFRTSNVAFDLYSPDLTRTPANTPLMRTALRNRAFFEHSDDEEFGVGHSMDGHSQSADESALRNVHSHDDDSDSNLDGDELRLPSICHKLNFNDDTQTTGGEDDNEGDISRTSSGVSPILSGSRTISATGTWTPSRTPQSVARRSPRLNKPVLDDTRKTTPPQQNQGHDENAVIGLLRRSTTRRQPPPCDSYDDDDDESPKSTVSKMARSASPSTVMGFRHRSLQPSSGAGDHTATPATAPMANGRFRSMRDGMGRVPRLDFSIAESTSKKLRHSPLTDRQVINFYPLKTQDPVYVKVCDRGSSADDSP